MKDQPVNIKEDNSNFQKSQTWNKTLMAVQFLFMPMVIATIFLVYNISLSNQILNLGEKIAYYQNEENTTKLKIEKFEELLENERKRHANDIRLFYIRFLHYNNFS